jgi:acetyl/propionyl-CoA carboxylase alpha subunit
MLAKLITWGAGRDEAANRMRAALIEYRIEGPTTNIPFLRWIIEHEDFRGNRVHTRWLESVQGSFAHPGIGFGRREEVAAIAAVLFTARRRIRPAGASSDGAGPGGGPAPWVRVGRARRLGRRA